jgi:hypothetical protein
LWIAFSDHCQHLNSSCIKSHVLAIWL